MNILYGVCGEGFGHSSRALIIADLLQRMNHKVLIVTYGKAYDVLKSRFDTLKIKGFSITTKKGVVKKRETVKVNIRNVKNDLLSAKRIRKAVKDFKPDLCMADMETTVPIIAYWYKLPLISIDNQHRLTNLNIKIPKRYYKDFIIAKSIVKAFIHDADYYIITSFINAKIRKKNTFIVPPIIRPEVMKLRPTRGNRLLVYLSQKNDDVIKVLKELDEKFIVYGYNENKRDENIEFKTKDSFLDDLKSCKAIIATAGFTLISEALYLKKPYFAMPFKGQFEQVLNALFLKSSGMGDYSDDAKKEKIKTFIRNIDKYEKILDKYKIQKGLLEKTLQQVLKQVSAKAVS